jgi:multicomponent Na+:H+ antiporter subunit D
MPWTMAAFVAGGLSLIGVPLTVGFVSKWYLVAASLESGMWPVAVLIVASSLLAVVYVWRVVEAAYLSDAPDGRRVEEAPPSLLVPTYLLVAANVYFGIDAGLTTRVATRAAGILMGAGE